MRAWVGLALLAGSWLLGLGYYQPADLSAWAAVVALGTVLLTGRPARLPGGREIGISLAMLAVAAWFMPWPFRAAPLLIGAGLGLQLVPIPRRWPGPLGWGAVTAGVVLLAQSLAILAYAGHTARSHDLPWPLPLAVGAIARLLGVNAAADSTTVAMHSMRQVHRLAATWELLLDPATFCFFAGGLVLLGVAVWSRLPRGERWPAWMTSARALAVVVVAWLPIRVGLLIALYLHRAMTASMDSALTVMNQFLSPWMHLGLLVGPVLLAWWFVRLPPGGRMETAEPGGPVSTGPGRRWQHPAAMALVFAAVGVFTFVFQWDPVGAPKPGRIMVVERHSTWEPTTKPYNTTWYGELASYNYGAIYDYCSRFFEMSQLLQEEAINDETLSRCDVLVIKTPTESYSTDEVEAIGRFVDGGGGLLLVGDHTNVFLTSTYLNEVARPFGFKFRHDLLFRIGSPYVELHHPLAVPHPILQHLPAMHLAGSCSVDPGDTLGRAVMRTTGMWSLPPDYHSENFFPQAEYRPEMRYGAFIQLWATRYGKGRVLAFTDSTIFSNFSTFEPGKAELMLGMLQWLNGRSVFDGWVARLLLSVPLLLAAVALLVVGVFLAQGRDGAWLSLLVAGVFGWTVGAMTVGGVHRWAMPVPKAARPMVRVVIDRTVSEVPLCRGGFIQDEEGRGYGLLEQWIPRLGYFIARRSGDEAFSGQALVVICPTKSVTRQFREGLVDYVARGGKLLVIDSLGSMGTTANSLLWPFGMTVNHAAAPQGELALADGWPGIQLEGSCQITGGEPFMWVDGTPVAARTPPGKYGKGSVMAIGFGSLFNDQNMGGHWMQVPDAETFLRYQVLFAVIRGLVEDRPVAPPPPEEAELEQPPEEEAASP